MRKVLLFFCCMHLSTSAWAQVENLVFEGAGIRGIAYAGVLKALNEQGKLGRIQRVAGTSAGAITALLFALGYSPEEMEKIVSDTRFQHFNQGAAGFLGGFYRLGRSFGWYRTEAFSQWLGKLISAKTGNENCSLAELAQRGYPALYLTASSLTQQRCIVLSAQTYPQMKVKDAVRISMSIPLYFEAAWVDSLGSLHKKQQKGQHLELMVDGGILANFPIEVFDSLWVDSLGQGHRIANPKTLGIRIDSQAQIDYDEQGRGLAPFRIQKFSDYLGAFYTLGIERLNRQTLTVNDWKRTISVSSVGIGPKVKKLSAAQKQALVFSGWQAATKYCFSVK